MATIHSIPSQLNTDSTDPVTATPAATASWESGELPRRPSYLYITALLSANTITIDGIECTTVGPVGFSSPIQCTTFTPSAIGQVAYYEQ